MTLSVIIARFSRYASGAMILGLIAFEICSPPILIFAMGMLSGGPRPPKLASTFGPLVILSPLIAIVILAICWIWLEGHRKFYPPAAVLLALGWAAFFVTVPKSSSWVIVASYALWHVMFFDWVLSLFGLSA
jgi:hypothetical protein